jgi:hypothetical protein
LHRFERRDKFGDAALLGPAECLGRLDGDGGKPDQVTRPTPPDGREVGRDDGGYLGIAAHSLVIGQQHNRSPRAGHLDCPVAIASETMS